MTLVCTGAAAATVEEALAPLTADGRLLVTVREVEPEGRHGRAGASLRTERARR